MRKPWYLRLAAAMLLVLALHPTNASAQDVVKGTSVTLVNTQTADFVLLAGKNWAEKTKDGKVVSSFVETQRDDWSVYLTDASRKVDLQLDLFKKQVFYTDAATPQKPLYRILGSSAEVKGGNVVRVLAGTNTFSMVGPDRWTEAGADGKVAFTFTESSRDEWTAILFDASRKMELQLDLFKKEVRVKEGSSAVRPLYRILSASAVGK
jgi:hypothetical protein